jgi:hypothetical protein
MLQLHHQHMLQLHHQRCNGPFLVVYFTLFTKEHMICKRAYYLRGIIGNYFVPVSTNAAAALFWLLELNLPLMIFTSSNPAQECT